MKGKSESKGLILILKVIATVYLMVFDVYMFKEFFFEREDATSHTIAIVVGIILLVISVLLFISCIHGIGDARSAARRNNPFAPPPPPPAYSPSKGQAGKKKHKKKRR